MIYTIGHRESYEALFNNYPPERCIKIGRRLTDWKKSEGDEIYPPIHGGSAWLTVEEAQAYLDQEGLTNHSIYAMLCGPENTYEVEGNLHIIEDTLLVRI